MKGAGNILPILAIIALGILVVGTNPGILSGLGIGSTIDYSCSLAQPEYAVYRCEEKTVPPVNYVGGTSCGFLNLNDCIDFVCLYSNQVSGTSCTITSNSNDVMVSVSGYSTIELDQGSTYTVPYGKTVAVTKTKQFGQTLDFSVTYKGKFLEWTYVETGQTERFDGCSMFGTNIGYDKYNNLPVEAKTSLEPGQSEQYVNGYSSTMLAGNYELYNGQPVYCVKQGDASASLYSIKTTNTKGGKCYNLVGSVVADGDDGIECCPGDSFGNNNCNDNFKWDSYSTGEEPINIGCCKSGLCTEINCPGQGGWYFLQNEKVKYICLDNGQCKVNEREVIECSKSTDCSPPLTCDPATNKCVNVIVPVSCTQAGKTCCTEGMFAPNVGLRTCQQAGFNDDYVCVNGECVTNAEAAAGGCAWYDIICHMTSFWDWLVSSITGFFATVGVIALILVIVFIGFMVLKR